MLKKSEILRKIKSNTKDLSVNNSYTDMTAQIVFAAIDKMSARTRS